MTFSESVTGVDAGDFQLANTGLTGPGPINVTGSGANYSVTANTGTGDGTLGLNLVDDDTIVDGANNKLGGTGTTTTGNGSFTGEVYTIDKTKPVISGSATTQPGGANYTAGDVDEQGRASQLQLHGQRQRHQHEHRCGCHADSQRRGPVRDEHRNLHRQRR